ncbi:hypothetical protein DFH06DRAFT_1195926 [Mycena polygramma]|nr:hypothetical protein DFH06DRAFT_1195926 [Mycena polygramma]
MKFPGVNNEPCVLSAYLAFQTAIDHRMITPKPDTRTGYQACAARVYVPPWWKKNQDDKCATIIGSMRDGVYFTRNDITDALPMARGVLHNNIYDALLYHSYQCQGKHPTCRGRNAANGHQAREEVVKYYEEQAKSDQEKKVARDNRLLSSIHNRIREKTDIGPDGIREFTFVPEGFPNVDSTTTNDHNPSPEPPFPDDYCTDDRSRSSTDTAVSRTQNNLTQGPSSRIDCLQWASTVANSHMDAVSRGTSQKNHMSEWEGSSSLDCESVAYSGDDERTPSPNPEILRGGSSSPECEGVQYSDEEDRMPSPSSEMLRIMSEWGGSDSSDCDGECEYYDEPAEQI